MSRQSRFDWGRLALMLAVAMAAALAFPYDAWAIGVTPGRNTLDFSPGLEKSITFTIINNENKQFDALVYAEGDLKDYVFAEKSVVRFTEGKASEQFTYRVKLPQEMAEPGEHWAKIVVMELPPSGESGNEGSLVLATTAVVHQLKVNVPYPGKFARAELVVPDAGPGQPVGFLVKVLNLGEQDIQSAWATIDILGPTNERIATLETNRASVKSKSRGELSAAWDADVNPGTYHAVATVHYDEKVTRAESNFGVGNMLIDILGVSVKGFRLGGVAKFEIDVESKWGEKISGVYAEMEVLRQDGDVMASFKSASADIGPMGRQTLYAYWDTDGVEKGDYEASLRLHYAGKVTEKRVSAYVGFDSIETAFEGGVTGRAVSSPGGGAGMGDLSMYIILLVVVLIGINGFWFIKMRGRGSKGK